jgi:hypothetical protein
MGVTQRPSGKASPSVAIQRRPSAVMTQSGSTPVSMPPFLPDHGSARKELSGATALPAIGVPSAVRARGHGAAAGLGSIAVRYLRGESLGFTLALTLRSGEAKSVVEARGAALWKAGAPCGRARS